MCLKKKKKNAAIPIGIILGPSENYLLFNLLFDFLHSIYPFFDLRIFPILSDEGNAISKFINLHDMEEIHFYCFRHLIEKVGSFTPIAAVTRRLLFIPTLDQYIASLPQAISDVNEFIKNNLVTSNGIQKFINIFNLNFNNNQIYQNDIIDHKNGLWRRAPYGISSCSNHIERLHRTLNEATAGSYSITKKHSIVISEITKYYSNYSEKSRNQVKKTVKKLIERANNSKNSDIERKTCSCGWSEIYSCRFGIPNFPCIHTILSVINDLHIENLERPSMYDRNKKIVLDNHIPEWNPDGFPSPKDNQNISKVEEMFMTFETKNEQEFISQVVNEIYFMKNKQITKENLLIQISIHWGRETSPPNDWKKNDVEFRSSLFVK